MSINKVKNKLAFPVRFMPMLKESREFDVFGNIGNEGPRRVDRIRSDDSKGIGLLRRLRSYNRLLS